jgi:hypothetical protein
MTQVPMLLMVSLIALVAAIAMLIEQLLRRDPADTGSLVDLTHTFVVTAQDDSLAQAANSESETMRS